MTNDGSWIGMGTKPVSYPFVIPRFSNAIIQVGRIVDSVALETNRGTIEVPATDGWANPYQWPRKVTPVVITGLPVMQKAIVRVRALQPRIIG